jgi:hypothetical protein
VKEEQLHLCNTRDHLSHWQAIRRNEFNLRSFVCTGPSITVVGPGIRVVPCQVSPITVVATPKSYDTAPGPHHTSGKPGFNNYVDNYNKLFLLLWQTIILCKRSRIMQLLPIPL